jgi:hypothetical protein
MLTNKVAAGNVKDYKSNARQGLGMQVALFLGDEATLASATKRLCSAAGWTAPRSALHHISPLKQFKAHNAELVAALAPTDVLIEIMKSSPLPLSSLLARAPEATHAAACAVNLQHLSAVPRPLLVPGVQLPTAVVTPFSACLQPERATSQGGSPAGEAPHQQIEPAVGTSCPSTPLHEADGFVRGGTQGLDIHSILASPSDSKLSSSIIRALKDVPWQVWLRTGSTDGCAPPHMQAACEQVFKGLAVLTHLQQLSVRWCGMEAQSISMALSSLTRLTSLDLSGARLPLRRSRQNASAFFNWPRHLCLAPLMHLSELHLSRNALSNSEMEEIASSRNLPTALEHLILDNNHVSCFILFGSLLNALPKLSVLMARDCSVPFGVDPTTHSSDLWKAVMARNGLSMEPFMLWQLELPSHRNLRSFTVCLFPIELRRTQWPDVVFKDLRGAQLNRNVLSADFAQGGCFQGFNCAKGHKELRHLSICLPSCHGHAPLDHLVDAAWSSNELHSSMFTWVRSTPLRRLEKLVLKHCASSSEEWKALSQRLKELTRLSYLMLHDCKMDDRAVRSISKAVKRLPLSKFSLRSCDLRSGASQVLAHALTHLQSLRALSWYTSSSSRAAGHAVLNALRELTHLTSFATNLTQRTGDLAAALDGLKCLKGLGLINAEGGRVIVQTLSRLPLLRSVTFQDCRFNEFQTGYVCPQLLLTALTALTVSGTTLDSLWHCTMPPRAWLVPQQHVRCLSVHCTAWQSQHFQHWWSRFLYVGTQAMPHLQALSLWVPSICDLQLGVRCRPSRMVQQVKQLFENLQRLELMQVGGVGTLGRLDSGFEASMCPVDVVEVGGELGAGMNISPHPWNANLQEHWWQHLAPRCAEHWPTYRWLLRSNIEVLRLLGACPDFDLQRLIVQELASRRSQRKTRVYFGRCMEHVLDSGSPGFWQKP